MDWNAIENAVVSWVKAGTGLGTVILAKPNQARPVTDYADVEVTDGGGFGGQAEKRIGPNPTQPPPAGQEVQVVTVRQKILIVTVNVFTAAVQGSSSAQALLSKAQTALESDAQIAAWRAVGISLQDRGTVQRIDALLETRFEGRAVLALHFNATDSITEYVTNIATVNVTPSWT